LFMRLKSGKIWYVPGFGDDRQGLKQWPALLNAEEASGLLGIGPRLSKPEKPILERVEAALA